MAVCGGKLADGRLDPLEDRVGAETHSRRGDQPTAGIDRTPRPDHARAAAEIDEQQPTLDDLEVRMSTADPRILKAQTAARIPSGDDERPVESVFTRRLTLGGHEHP